MIKDFKIENRFEYKGYPCVVLFVRGWRCGYVGIPKGHKYYEKDHGDMDIECHGGLTYCHKYLADYEDKDTWWIGFDCNHCFDREDFETAKKYFKNNAYLMSYIARLEEFHNWDCRDEFATVKDQYYVEQECKYIVDQLEVKK